MDWYDIFMLAVLGLATLMGAWKGMAWQLASLASLVASYFLALKYSAQLAPLFSQTAPWNRFVAMLAIYLGTSVAVWLGFRLVAGFLDRIKLRDFDHQVGALFGLVKGGLLCVAITFFAVGLSEALRAHILATRSGHYIALLLNKAETIMPPEIHQVLDPYVQKIEDRLNPNAPYQPNSPVEQDLQNLIPSGVPRSASAGDTLR
jgi:membrane protein required for colicin V production